MAARLPAKKVPTRPTRPRKTAPRKVADKPVPVAAPERVTEARPAKVKLVRDSFTFPKNEYAAVDMLKQRAAKAGLPSKKSEVLRAGLMALAAMGDAAFQSAMSAVPTLKTGRPKKSRD